MITGGNSGIGKCIAFAIAKRGGTVHLVCRNTKSGEEVKSEINEVTGNPVRKYVYKLLLLLLTHFSLFK